MHGEVRLTGQPRQVRDRAERPQHTAEQRQAVVAQGRIRIHDHHCVEERVDRRETSGIETGNVALRVPEAAIARAVVERLGLPITATSANLHGHPECTYANCVRDQIGDRLDLIVDGGPTARAVPTTIVDLSGGGSSWMILREGAIPTHEIALTLQR